MGLYHYTVKDMTISVAVVGGGLAGLSTIYGLIYPDIPGTDIYVQLFDKKQEIGSVYKSSGAIASYWLDKLPFKIPKKVVESSIRKAYIHAWKTSVEISPRKLLGIVIDHRLLEKFILQKMRKCVAQTRVEIQINLSSYIQNPLELLHEYDYVVGADGVFSNTAKHLVGEIPREEAYRCVEYWVKKNHKKDLHIFFKEYCPKGYIWVIPSNGYIKVGAGVPLAEKTHPDEVVEAFMKEHERYSGEIFKKIYGVVPTPTPLGNVVVADRVALVGDAGRLVNAATGGGIHLAIMSGYAAGRSLREVGNFSNYAKWYRKIYPLLDRWRKIRDVIRGLTIKELGKVLLDLSGETWLGSETNPVKGFEKLIKFIIKHPILAAKIGVKTWR